MKRSAITVRQIEFLRLGEKRVLLIIVMPDGEVENRVLSKVWVYPSGAVRPTPSYGLEPAWADTAEMIRVEGAE